jgi:hypothetical protein
MDQREPAGGTAYGTPGTGPVEQGQLIRHAAVPQARVASVVVRAALRGPDRLEQPGERARNRPATDLASVRRAPPSFHASLSDPPISLVPYAVWECPTIPSRQEPHVESGAQHRSVEQPGRSAAYPIRLVHMECLPRAKAVEVVR